MPTIKEEDIFWMDPIDNGVSGHALVWRGTWCVVNDKDRIAVYRKYFLQGNNNEDIAMKVILPNLTKFGAVGIKLIPLVILPDEPSRY